MFDRIQQHASHPTTRTSGPRTLTWRGVLAGFLLAAAIPVAVLVVSYPVAAVLTVSTALVVAAGLRALAGHGGDRKDDAPRMTADGVVDGD